MFTLVSWFLLPRLLLSMPHDVAIFSLSSFLGVQRILGYVTTKDSSGASSKNKGKKATFVVCIWRNTLCFTFGLFPSHVPAWLYSVCPGGFAFPLQPPAWSWFLNGDALGFCTGQKETLVLPSVLSKNASINWVANAFNFFINKKKHCCATILHYLAI